MRKYIGTLISVGDRGHDGEEIAFDAYAISRAGDLGLIKISFTNGVSLADDEDDLPVKEILLAQSAFISFAVADTPTVTISKAEYDSLKETVEILGSPEAMKDIQEAIIQAAMEAILKGELVPADVKAAANEAAEAARARLQKAGDDDAQIQKLADEAEAGYDPDQLVPRRAPGTENLVISRDNQ